MCYFGVKTLPHAHGNATIGFCIRKNLIFPRIVDLLHEITALAAQTQKLGTTKDGGGILRAELFGYFLSPESSDSQSRLGEYVLDHGESDAKIILVRTRATRV